MGGGGLAAGDGSLVTGGSLELSEAGMGGGRLAAGEVRWRQEAI